jgi:hypothetical protein
LLARQHSMRRAGKYPLQALSSYCPSNDNTTSLHDLHLLPWQVGATLALSKFPCVRLDGSRDIIGPCGIATCSRLRPSRSIRADVSPFANVDRLHREKCCQGSKNRLLAQSLFVKDTIVSIEDNISARVVRPCAGSVAGRGGGMRVANAQ